MSTKDILISTLSNTSLWSAICSTIFIIGLGYLLLKIKVFKSEWKTPINAVVLKVALPALAFTGFMKSISIKELSEQGIILGVSFAFYISLCFIAYVWVNYLPNLLPKVFKKQNRKKFEYQKISASTRIVESITTEKGEDLTKRSLVMWMMLIFGSVTSFGLPIIKQLYDSQGGTIAANIWTIPFRIFLYSYCIMLMSGIKFSKSDIKKNVKIIFLNPTVILTFLGIVLWLTQLIPGASNFGLNFTYGTSGWFELKVTLPYIYDPINKISSLMSPLIWISIGMTLAESKISNAVRDKWVWIFSIQKLILIPLIVFLIMLPLVSNKLVTIPVAISMVIFASVPPATVVNAYTMQFNVCEKFASECSALSTLLAILALPVWIIISNIFFYMV